jgi:hypothetical protein
MPKPVAGVKEGETLSLKEFQDAVQGIAHGRGAAAVENPLEAVTKVIGDNPAFAQSRLLARVLRALVNRHGSFRQAEIAAFDALTLAMVSALIDMHAAGTVACGIWAHAAAKADADLLAAGGTG